MQQTASSLRLGGRYHADLLTPPRLPRGVPELRMSWWRAPHRPASLPTHDGVEIHAFVPQLTRQPAACDLGRDRRYLRVASLIAEFVWGPVSELGAYLHPCRRRSLSPCTERLKPL
jgi:hypothetical protein